jgi:acyl carrier protein
VDKLKQVIADALQVPVESVADDSSPASLPQWDSLAHLNLIMSLEQEFHVKFTVEEIVQLENVPTIRRFLQSKSSA